MAARTVPAAGIVGVLAALVACADVPDARRDAAPSPTRPSASSPGQPTTRQSVPPDGAARRTAPAPANPRRVSRPAVMKLSIPDIGVRGLRVVAYTGSADDRPGTRIQNRGVAATPRGPGGGGGPGEIGNFIVTAHRTTHGRPFGDLPKLRSGAIISVTTPGVIYEYRITGTMTISFRWARSKALQSAPVPGRPGVQPTRPMITLSTCATPQDVAQGNYWKDSLGNLEHRIDKIGVLVAVRRS